MSDGETGCLVLTGELSIYQAAEVRQRLLEWCQQCPLDAALDLAGITEMDSAGLQLLLSLERSLAECGKQLRITAVSQEVQAVLALAGLSQWCKGAGENA